MTSDKSIFYVYYYLRHQDSKRATKGTPYYVGKGKDKRAWAKHAESSRPADAEDIVLVATDLYEDEAFDMEIAHIKLWGRIDQGVGVLHNRTDGGDGTSGFKHRPGRPAPNKGKPCPRKGMPLPARVGVPAWNKGLKGRTTSLKGRPSPLIGRTSPVKGVPHTEERKANTKAAVIKWWADRKLAQQNLRNL